MSFFKRKQNMVEWTEKTAPKELPVHLEFKVKVRTMKSDSCFTSDTKEIGTIEGTETLLFNTDSERNLIKENIEQKMAEMYEKICALIDVDSQNLTDGFWAEKKQKDSEKS